MTDEDVVPPDDQEEDECMPPQSMADDHKALSDGQEGDAEFCQNYCRTLIKYLVRNKKVLHLLRQNIESHAVYSLCLRKSEKFSHLKRKAINF